MTSAIAISLLGSLALFLGLSSLARQRQRASKVQPLGVLSVLLGLLGMAVLLVQGQHRAALMALLIGLLGYVFGYVTTPRATLARPVAPTPTPQVRRE